MMTSLRGLGWTTALCGALSGCGDDGRTDSAGLTMTGSLTTTGASAPTGTDTEAATTTTAPTSTSEGGMSESASEATTGEPTSTGVATTTSSTGETTAGVCPADCEAKGGVCIGEECCPDEDHACGDVCCPQGDICSFNTCVTPGDACIDASECGDDEYCEYSLGEPAMMGGDEMCMGGIVPATGKCLPSPPKCMEGEDPGDPPTCLATCQYIPGAGQFTPSVKYHWDAGTVMMTPIVVQLDDDNCDAIVDERDIPEIAFTTFVGGVYQENGTIRVISIVGGEIVEKWTYNAGMVDPIAPGRELAGGDIDGLPGNELVACSTTGKTRAFTGDGQPLWTSTYSGACHFVSIADLDQDGKPEVIVPGAVLDGATGATELMLGVGGHNMAADLDSDGQLDIVYSRGAFNAAGGVLATTGLEGTYPAIADLDLDGKPEVAVISNANSMTVPHHLLLWRHDPQAMGGAQILRAGIDINGALSPDLCPEGSAGNLRGGGPPTIADFNGDGTPDVAVAGGVGYAVFDGKKLMDPNVADEDTFMWIKQTRDCSSASTGSSVFDFDGDGSAEVVYSDEIRLRVYRGSDGEELWSTCNTTGTLQEYPVIADVDSDGHADIVAVSNNYSGITCDGTKQTGVRIFGDSEGQWVRTRRVWNQHAYHVTNTEEGGKIPAIEPTNWLTPGLNNYRQNVQPEGEFAAPDLIVDLRLSCEPDPYGLVGRVRNIGEASVPAGVPVHFFEGDPMNGGTLLGSGVTTKVLYPAEAEDVTLLLPNAPPGVLDGSSVVWVVVDDAMPMHAWHECRVDNNSASGTGQCPLPG
ncbi:FG-GAP-like repeat-containing protein [Nannocystis sp. ILAH1]|uniref:FG-GAP repeat domain-containing protein n=1 Tax=unclassified Nannocystis TaxID=2627009 RepID=UPI002271FB8F|nr:MULTISPECIES: FG-GAP-like repeat-containing protein [unclassified Nannocystis]MCY0986383.1 FG-GAP-like repeat-containing protein [Nannocystis sp. ILAH1]MCY1067171.1 FG-GAP-like repeat-containing protein [Nannocystis sp. RBIL2]